MSRTIRAGGLALLLAPAADRAGKAAIVDTRRTRQIARAAATRVRTGRINLDD